MHEVETDSFRKRRTYPLLLNRHHIIFVELYDLHLLFYRKLIPFEIFRTNLIPLNKKRADRSQYHRIRVLSIEFF